MFATLHTAGKAIYILSYIMKYDCLPSEIKERKSCSFPDTYTVKVSKSEENMGNDISFYKEDGKV